MCLKEMVSKSGSVSSTVYSTHGHLYRNVQDMSKKLVVVHTDTGTN